MEALLSSEVSKLDEMVAGALYIVQVNKGTRRKSKQKLEGKLSENTVDAYVCISVMGGQCTIRNRHEAAFWPHAQQSDARAFKIAVPVFNHTFGKGLE